MLSMQTIIVYGQDPRMDFVAGYFYHLGYEVYEEFLDDIEAYAIITSPTISYEMERELTNKANQGQILYYGILSKESLGILQSRGVVCRCYLNWENFVEKNAVLTAQGIVHEAIKAGAVLCESHCLVAGYGHCAKALIPYLIEEGAHVDVLVRRRELRHDIEALGCGYLSLQCAENICFDKYSYLFNTIPAVIFDRAMVHRLPLDIMIFDIASKPGGVDYNLCRSMDIWAKLYSSIPGKLYPQKAGEIVASCILDYEKEHPLTQE